MAITDLETFKTACLVSLGQPVIKINVATEQIDQAIDDAVMMFNERHYKGSFTTFFKYTVTAADISRNTADEVVVGDTGQRPSYIPLPDSVMTINKLIYLNTSSSVFSYEWQLNAKTIMDISRSGSLQTYLLNQDKLEQLQNMFSKLDAIRFNHENNQLYIDVDWGKDIKEGDVIVCEAVIKTDVLNSVKLLNDTWFKKYTTSLIKKYWGQNLSKFEGMQMPGGIQLNGRQILDDAINEITILEEQLLNSYELPVDFFMR